jgi:hypothetical protein
MTTLTTEQQKALTGLIRSAQIVTGYTYPDERTGIKTCGICHSELIDPDDPGHSDADEFRCFVPDLEESVNRVKEAFQLPDKNPSNPEGTQ